MSVNQKSTANTGIAYQNKDITAKVLSENLRNKSFSVYGLELPRIVDVLPTNLPAIEANELRLDNLFRLEDDTLALIDYESDYADEDKIKYLSYIIRTLKRNLRSQGLKAKIRMIVIYTADIQPGQTRPAVNVGCLQFKVEEIFLSSLHSEEIEAELRTKITENTTLTEEDQMKFIILPLTYKGKKNQQECIWRCFHLAEKLDDIRVQTFVLSGMLVFADKIIPKNDSERMRNWIMMTQIGQLFEDEKIEYGRKIQEEAKKATKKAVKKAKKATAKKTELEIATNMLAKGFPADEILAITKLLTREDIDGIKKHS